MFSKKIRNPVTLIPLSVLITNIGNGMNTLAVGKILYDQTGAVSAFAFVMIMKNILKFVTQVIASTSVDRGRAKQSAFVAEGLRGIIIIICSIMAFKGHVSGIMLGTIFISLLSPFYRTATFAIGPIVADGVSLAKYNARSSTALQIGQLLGAGLAGLIMTVASPILAVTFNGVSYLISALLIAIASIPNQSLLEKEGKGLKEIMFSLEPKKFIGEWHDLIKNLKENPWIVFLIALSTVDILIVYLINISYVPILDQIKGGNWWIAVWDCAFALGAVIGANIFGNIKHLHKPLKMTFLCLLVQGIFIISFGFKSTIFILIAMGLIGVSNAYSVSSFNYTLQKTAKQKFHGRVSGVRQLMTTITLSVCLPLVSKLLSVKIFNAVLIVSIISMLASLAVFKIADRMLIPSIVEEKEKVC